MQYTVGTLAKDHPDKLKGYYSLILNFCTNYLALVLLDLPERSLIFTGLPLFLKGVQNMPLFRGLAHYCR